jgi:hypothetical protein
MALANNFAALIYSCKPIPIPRGKDFSMRRADAPLDDKYLLEGALLSPGTRRG